MVRAGKLDEKATTRGSRPPGALGILIAALLAAVATLPAFGAGAHEPMHVKVSGDVHPVHDPSMIESRGHYYLFTTGRNIPMRCSPDLIHWKGCGAVFPAMPHWAAKDIPQAATIWAPDVSFFDGLFHLYFAVSTFGSNRSDIGLATTPALKPDGGTEWTDHGRVFESVSSDPWNAIDPNIVLDGNGQPWLAFGSFWSGLYLMKIDPATGRPYPGQSNLHHLAQRLQPPDAIEASFIIRRKGFYYLFASYDFCCRGINSTYNIRVGRSRHVIGPYRDRTGVPMLEGGGTLIAFSHGRWRGPGGESVLHAANGKWWLVYHAYDADLGGTPVLRIARLRFDRAGWPRPVTPLPKAERQS